MKSKPKLIFVFELPSLIIMICAIFLAGTSLGSIDEDTNKYTYFVLASTILLAGIAILQSRKKLK